MKIAPLADDRLRYACFIGVYVMAALWGVRVTVLDQDPSGEFLFAPRMGGCGNLVVCRRRQNAKRAVTDTRILGYSAPCCCRCSALCDLVAWSKRRMARSQARCPDIPDSDGVCHDRYALPWWGSGRNRRTTVRKGSLSLCMPRDSR